MIEALRTRWSDAADWASGLIAPFQTADGPPPQTLGAFFKWSLKGSMPVLWGAAGLSALAGTMEVMTALILGRVIDAAVSTDPLVFFAENWLLLSAFAAFFLLLRPLSIGLSAAANAIMVQPNVMPLVLSRLHRWTLGQAVTFFDDDFAGRIAQKQMQTARAITEVTSEMINVVAFALASLLGSVLLADYDQRLGVVVAAGLASGLFRRDQLVPAEGAHPLEGPGRGARDGVGAGRGHDHQHQDRQAVRPLQPRGNRGARRDGIVPQNRRSVRAARGGVPVRPDGAGGGLAGAADRIDLAVLAGGFGQCGRYCCGWRDCHSDRANDGVGQLHAHGALFQCGRGRGWDADAHAASCAERRVGRDGAGRAQRRGAV